MPNTFPAHSAASSRTYIPISTTNLGDAEKHPGAAQAIPTEVDADIVFPEGTLWGWLAVLGGFCLCVSTLGFTLSWGAFQAYYERVLLRNHSSSEIAWIGSIQYSMTFLPGIVAGRLFDSGYFRACLTFGSILYVLANFLLAECKHYWQFLLCQGFALGLACGFLYVPCVSTISQWFKIKRPIAFSLAAMGVSVGGIIFPIMFRKLVVDVGFPWTIRCMAFVNLAMFIIAHFTMFTRLPPTKSLTGSSWIDFDGLFNIPYVLYITCTFIAFLGLYTYLTFIPLSAVSIDINTALAFDLVAVANAASTLGRLGGGVLAMRYGPVNSMITFTFFAGIFIFIWPFVKTQGGFIAVVVLYGISSGAFVALFPAGTSSLGSISDVGRRQGVQMTIMALGALAGPPISGEILRAKNDFRHVGIYAGSTVVLSVGFMMATRYAAVGKLYGGKV